MSKNTILFESIKDKIETISSAGTRRFQIRCSWSHTAHKMSENRFLICQIGGFTWRNWTTPSTHKGFCLGHFKPQKVFFGLFGSSLHNETVHPSKFSRDKTGYTRENATFLRETSHDFPHIFISKTACGQLPPLRARSEMGYDFFSWSSDFYSQQKLYSVSLFVKFIFVYIFVLPNNVGSSMPS